MFQKSQTSFDQWPSYCVYRLFMEFQARKLGREWSEDDQGWSVHHWYNSNGGQEIKNQPRPLTWLNFASISLYVRVIFEIFSQKNKFTFS